MFAATDKSDHQINKCSKQIFLKFCHAHKKRTLKTMLTQNISIK